MPTHGQASISRMGTAISRRQWQPQTAIGAHQRGKAIGLMNREKIPAGKCPCRMEMIHPTIGWRQDKQGTQNMHTAHGFSDLYHVFAWNQCILGPALRHGCLTLLICYIDLRFEISGPGTIAHGSIRRLSCSLTQLCTLMGWFSICAPRKIDLIYFMDWEGCYNNHFL